MAKSQGVGVRTGGRRLTFELVVARLVGVFVFACVGVAFEFALPLRFVLWFADRFELLFRLSVALAFRFAGLRLLALAFELFADDELLSWLAGEALAFALVFEFDGVETSPSLVGRLISTATVWPTFTISPACGNWIKTVPGWASLVARSARTRKFNPASLIVFSAASRSFPTMSGTRVSELRSDR